MLSVLCVLEMTTVGLNQNFSGKSPTNSYSDWNLQSRVDFYHKQQLKHLKLSNSSGECFVETLHSHFCIRPFFTERSLLSHMKTSCASLMVIARYTLAGYWPCNNLATIGKKKKKWSKFLKQHLLKRWWNHVSFLF